MSTIHAQRSDPVGDSYYSAVGKADKLSDWLFYVGAVLSIMVLFIDKEPHPTAYHFVMVAFALVVIALFVLGLVTRLYLTPRAEEKRRLDFFTSALGINLTHETSVNYYNNAQTEPVKRMAAQLLENTHFTKAISLKMVRWERAKVVVYALAWILCMMSPNADLGLIVAASQAIFSEQIISRYCRLEWLRARCETLYDDVHRSFTSNAVGDAFRAHTLNSLVSYETTKAIAAVTLSSKIFHGENKRLSDEWETIKRSLGI